MNIHAEIITVDQIMCKKSKHAVQKEERKRTKKRKIHRSVSRKGYVVAFYFTQ